MALADEPVVAPSERASGRASAGTEQSGKRASHGRAEGIQEGTPATAGQRAYRRARQSYRDTGGYARDRASRGIDGRASAGNYNERAGERTGQRAYNRAYKRAYKRAYRRVREELPRHQRMRKRTSQPCHQRACQRPARRRHGRTSQRTSQGTSWRWHQRAGAQESALVRLRKRAYQRAYEGTPGIAENTSGCVRERASRSISGQASHSTSERASGQATAGAGVLALAGAGWHWSIDSFFRTCGSATWSRGLHTPKKYSPKPNTSILPGHNSGTAPCQNFEDGSPLSPLRPVQRTLKIPRPPQKYIWPPRYRRSGAHLGQSAIAMRPVGRMSWC